MSNWLVTKYQMVSSENEHIANIQTEHSVLLTLSPYEE